MQRPIRKKKLYDAIQSFCDASSTVSSEDDSETYTLQFGRSVRAFRLITTMTQLVVPEHKQARRHFRIKYIDTRLLRWTGTEQWRLIYWVLDGSNREDVRALAPLAENLKNSLLKLISICNCLLLVLQKVQRKEMRFSKVNLNELINHLAFMDEQLANFELQEVISRSPAFLYSGDQLDCIQEMAILYLDAFHWAMYYGIFTLEQMEESALELMVGLPRLAVMVGIRVLDRGPLQPSCPKWGEPRYPVLFEAYRRDLDYLWRQLWCLSELEFVQLAHCMCQVNQRERDYWVFLPERWKKLVPLQGNLTPLLDIETAAENVCSRGREGNVAIAEVYLANLTPIFRAVCKVADSLQSEHANANRLMMQAVHSWSIMDENESTTNKPLNPTSSAADITLNSPLTSSHSKILADYLKREFDAAFTTAPTAPCMRQIPLFDYQSMEGEFTSSATTLSRSKETRQQRLPLFSGLDKGITSPDISPYNIQPHLLGLESLVGSPSLSIDENRDSEIVEVGVDALEALHWSSSAPISNSASLTDSLTLADDKKVSRLLSLPSFMECLATPPVWQNDDKCDECSHCQRELTLAVWIFGTRRKHHCRRCGYIFCSSCWSSRKCKRYLPTLGLSGLQPVCVNCAEVLPPSSHSLVTLPLLSQTFLLLKSRHSPAVSHDSPIPQDDDNSLEASEINAQNAPEIISKSDAAVIDRRQFI